MTNQNPPIEKPIGHAIQHVDRLPSTNSWLLEHPDQLACHGLVLVAEHQTAGRGRQQKSWISLPHQQLQCSVVIHPSPVHAGIGYYAILAAVALAEALEHCSPQLSPQLKWPNDIWLKGKKVAGILVEIAHGAHGQRQMVMGIGVNCLGTGADFPPNLQPLLTTLSEVAEQPISPQTLLPHLLNRLQHWHQALCHQASWQIEKAALLAAWEKRGLLGSSIRVRVPQQEAWGHPVGLDQEGFLRIAYPDGSLDTAISAELDWDF